MSQTLPGEPDDLLLRRLMAGPQRHHRLDGLAPVVIRNADHRHVGHRRVLGHGLLDLGRVDVLPARDDHVLDPVGYEQVPAVADVPDIAGAQPAVVGDRLGGVFRPVQVAHHSLRRPEPELTRLSGGGVPAGGQVHHPHLRAGQHRTRRAEPVFARGVPVRWRGRGADPPGQLGLAVNLNEVQRGPRRQRLPEHRKRHGRRPVEQVLQPVQRGDRVVARGEQRGYHRRHQERVGGPGGERRQQ